MKTIEWPMMQANQIVCAWKDESGCLVTETLQDALNLPNKQVKGLDFEPGFRLADGGPWQSVDDAKGRQE